MRAGQGRRWIIEQFSEAQGELRPTLGNNVTALQQDAADLVHQGRPLPDELIANTVQGLHVKLRLGLEGDEAHRRTGCRLGDRLGVAIVVLVSLHVGSNVLRRHEPDRVPLSR
jgi:hypothetical protein